MVSRVNNLGYEITSFRPDLTHEVVKLLGHLWGEDSDKNIAYFDWKYNQNPYTERLLGIVALHKNKVVGFRGYFATKYKISRTDREIIVLCPGDTCVLPDHRRRRLSLVMGDLAMNEYSREYPIFMNFTGSKNSVPGYIKLGFIPIIPKVYITKSNTLGLVKFILFAKKNKDLKNGKIKFGEFGALIVSDRPNAEAMHNIIFKQKYASKKIRLFQDEEFFLWRFNNKKLKYVFYYYKENDKISGYIVIRATANNRRGYIIDYSAEDSIKLEKLFELTIKMKHFDILSIYNYSLTTDILNLLKKLKFKTDSIVQMIERKVEGEWPLLVRPVKKKFVERQFFVEGLDIRKIQSWSIREICSDSS